MHVLEIILLTLGILVGTAGFHTLLRAKSYTKPIGFRRFDDL